jgi:asparagine synthase (glutamine-hydrolysing)
MSAVAGPVREPAGAAHRTAAADGQWRRDPAAHRRVQADERIDAIFAPEFAAHIDARARRYASVMTDDKLQFVLTRQVPWHHFSRLSVEQSQLTVRTPYLDNELVQLSFRAPPSLATSNAVALRLIADGNPALGRFGTDRGVAHRSIPLVTPLRNFFQEFTFKAEYAYDYGMPHWLARADSALRPLHLEKLFLGRHKFYHFRYWYRNQLAGFLKDVLLDPRSLARPYLDRVCSKQWYAATSPARLTTRWSCIACSASSSSSGR